MTLGGNALEGESDGGESEEGCNDEGENDEWREKGVALFGARKGTLVVWSVWSAFDVTPCATGKKSMM